MPLDRRDFLTLLGLLGAAAPSALAQAADETPVPYSDAVKRLKDVKLFLVPYSHNDSSWFATETWHWERAALIDKRAVEIMQREDNFKWFTDVKFERMDRTAEIEPEVFEEMQRLAKEGRVAISAGTVVNNDNPFNEPEVAIRNMVLGRRYFEKNFPGINLEVASFIDIHPGHTQMPQMLAKGGYKYYRFTRPNWALDRKGYKREFVWEGMDGSDVLLSYGPYGWLAGGWGMGKGPGAYINEINDYKNDWEGAVEAFYNSVVKYLLANTATNVIWIPVGLDHTLPLSLPQFDEATGDEPVLDMPGFAREWKKREPSHMEFATPQEFYSTVEQQRSSIPRVTEAIDPVGWPFWYGQCGSKGLDNWRDRTDKYLVEAEIYASLATAIGADYPEKKIEHLWYKGLELFPHDGLYVGDEDMADSVELGQDVVYQSKAIRKDATRPFSHRIRAGRKHQTIAVFNPLSWTRREPVEIKAVFKLPGTTKVRLVDGQGRERKHQLLRVRHFNNPSEHMTPGAKNSYKEIWLAADIETPPMGYTTLRVEPVAENEEPRYVNAPTSVLENGYARITLGTAGVSAIVDKARGVTYQGAGNPIFYRNEDPWPWHGGPITGEDPIREARWKLIEYGPIRSRARMTGLMGGHGVEMEITLNHTNERIDYRVEIDSIGGSGYFAANVLYPFDSIPYAGIPFGAEKRDLSNEPWADGSNVNEELLRKNVFYAHHWVDNSDGDKGLTLLAAEGKRGFVFHPEKRSLEHILMMTIVPEGEMETLFSNPYFTGEGRHTFEYSLLPHAGGWRDVGAAQRAQEQIHPVFWRHVYSRKGADLPLERSFVTPNKATVAASSWQWRDGAFELRVYDASGHGGPVDLKLPASVRSCEAVDFNGRPMASPSITVSGDTAGFEIKPWEIVTLRFSLAT